MMLMMMNMTIMMMNMTIKLMNKTIMLMNMTSMMMNMMVSVTMMRTMEDRVTGRGDLGLEHHLPLGTAALCTHYSWHDGDGDGGDGDGDGAGDGNNVCVQRGPTIF